MKFKSGELPTSENFNPDEGHWTILKEPGNIWLYQIIALPVGIFLAAVIYIFVNRVLGISKPLDGILLLPLIIVIPIHELIHAAVFPDLFTNDVILGFYPKGLAFYAYYEGEIKRNRMVCVLIMPTIVLSVIPLVIMYLFHFKSVFLVQLSILNVIGACVDIVGACLTLFQVPMNAVMRLKGIKTYWSVKES